MGSTPEAGHRRQRLTPFTPPLVSYFDTYIPLDRIYERSTNVLLSGTNGLGWENLQNV